MNTKQQLLTLVAGLLLTSCGGGGGGSSAVSPAAPGAPGSTAQQKGTNGTVVLSIPTQASSSSVRYPQFVSPNASSVTIVVNSGTAQVFDVSATSSLCTTVSGARNCTLTFGAPTGSDTIVLSIFAGPNGTGTMLAAATSNSFTVTAGTPFSLTVALNAAIGTIVASIKSGTGGNCNSPTTTTNSVISEGCGGSGLTNGGAGLTVTAFDPSGAQITGTAPYATPIQISGNDPSLSASPTSITAPGQTVALGYSGAPLAQSIGNTATVSLTIGSQVVTISVPIMRANLYVANSNCMPGCTTPPGGGNIAVYAFGASGSATPIRTISGPSTGLSYPVVPILDSSGNLYVLDNGPYTTHSNPVILVFAPGTNGNVAPTRMITNIALLANNQPCDSFTLDPAGQYLVLVCDDVYNNGIHVIPATTSGAVTQTASLKCINPSPCFSHSVGVAFDPSGNLWVAETGMNDVFGFTKGSFSFSGGVGQNITPATTLNGTTGVPWPGNYSSPPYVSPLGVGFDVAGRMYVDALYANSTPAAASDALNRVVMWNASTLASCNSCAPSVALTGAPFTTHAPAGMAVDYAGNLYVGNQFNNTIYEFAQSTLGSSAANPAVLRTISTGSSPSTPTGMTIGP